MRIPSDFKAGAPISQVPVSWFKKVADFLNGFCVGVSPIKVTRPSTVDASSPVLLSFDPPNEGADETLMPRPSKAASTLPAGQVYKAGWERGGKSENGEEGVGGMRMMVITRIVRTGDYDNFFWAWGYFDRFGMLYRVTKEQGVFSELTKEGWLES